MKNASTSMSFKLLEEHKDEVDNEMEHALMKMGAIRASRKSASIGSTDGGGRKSSSKRKSSSRGRFDSVGANAIVKVFLGEGL